MGTLLPVVWEARTPARLMSPRNVAASAARAAPAATHAQRMPSRELAPGKLYVSAPPGNIYASPRPGPIPPLPGRFPPIARVTSCGRRCRGGRRRLSHRQEEFGQIPGDQQRGGGGGGGEREFRSGLAAGMGVCPRHCSIPSDSAGRGFGPTYACVEDHNPISSRTCLSQPVHCPTLGTPVSPSSQPCTHPARLWHPPYVLQHHAGLQCGLPSAREAFARQQQGFSLGRSPSGSPWSCGGKW